MSRNKCPSKSVRQLVFMGDYGHYSFYINYPKVRFHASVEGCCKWAARAAGWSKYPGKFEDDADELNGSI
jgi:hypothetical protein